MFQYSLPKYSVRKFLRTVILLVPSILYFQAYAAETTTAAEKSAPKEEVATSHKIEVINMDKATFSKGFENLKDLLNAASFDKDKIKIIGAKDAPLTLWDISSYSCPHCAAFHKDALPEIYTKYIETGKLRVAFLNASFDNLTTYITASTYATQNMEQYLAYTNMIYEDQNKWHSQSYQAELDRMLIANNITQDQLGKTLQSAELNKNIPQLIEYIGTVLKVQGTPTFILSQTGKSPEQELGRVEGNSKKAVIDLIEANLQKSTK